MEVPWSPLLLHLQFDFASLGPARVGFQDQTRGYSRYDQLSEVYTHREGKRVAGSTRMRLSKFSDWSGEHMYLYMY
jgi:hypothetical protein